jgi:DNA-binding CsgD family transcriptional regulator
VTLDLVEAAVDSGRLSEASRHVELLGRSGVSRHAPRTRLMWAGSAAITAAPQDRAALFARALALPGCERWPFEVARIRLRFGQHLRSSQDVAGAREQLAAALVTFRRLGAAPWEERAAGALRAAGATPDSAPTTALTPEEHRIATLAASGLTNRQIGELTHLSHRTVGARLHRIFPKLGVTTRAALRDALVRRSDD